MDREKTIAVLGATGSVGRQALDVARERGYRVDLLTAARSAGAIEPIARLHRPRTVVLTDPAAARDLKCRLADTDIRVFGGEQAQIAAIAESRADCLINAVSGAAGLRPTLAVLETGKRLALANKESLVLAGEHVMRAARARGVELIPVDSEHSAIFQSLRAGDPARIRRLLLTASGGPFFGCSREQLAAVTPVAALAHPTWRMGEKITVDSATLMNKGFEVIEAMHLFGVSPERIEVLVHRESILHSAVEFEDRAVIGEFSLPDMRMCVQYAVDHPDRFPSARPALDLAALGALTFAKPDGETFPLLPLAFRAATDGGVMGAVLNAADEVAVSAFLKGEISLPALFDVVCRVYERMLSQNTDASLDRIFDADAVARRYAAEEIAR